MQSSSGRLVSSCCRSSGPRSGYKQAQSVFHLLYRDIAIIAYIYTKAHRCLSHLLRLNERGNEGPRKKSLNLTRVTFLLVSPLLKQHLHLVPITCRQSMQQNSSYRLRSPIDPPRPFQLFDMIGLICSFHFREAVPHPSVSVVFACHDVRRRPSATIAGALGYQFQLAGPVVSTQDKVFRQSLRSEIDRSVSMK